MKKIMKKIRLLFTSILWSFKLLLLFFKDYFYFLIIIFLYLLPSIFNLEEIIQIKVPSYNSILAIYTVIIGSLSSMLGIIIAIQLVVLETLRKELTLFAVEGLLKNKSIRNLLILFVFTILASIISIYILSDPPKSQDAFRIYYSLTLFILIFILIFPLTRQLLVSSQTKKDILKLIYSVQYVDVNRYSQSTRRMTESDQITYIEKNKLFIISEICLRTIKNGDRLIPKLIIIELSKKLTQLLEQTDKEQSARNVIQSFLSVYYSIFNELVQNKQIPSIQILINAITKIHIYCAKEKVAWFAMIELNEFIIELSNTLVKDQLIDSCKRLIWDIEKIYLEHMSKNIPKEEDIWLLQDWKTIDREKIDQSKVGQWNGINDALPRVLYGIAEASIKEKNIEIFISIIDALNRLPESFLKLKLGEKINHFVIRNIYQNIDYLILQSIQDGLIKNDRSLFIGFNSLTIAEILKLNTTYSKYPLISLSNTLIIFAKSGIHYYLGLNELGTVGRILSHDLTIPINREALLFINDTLSKLFILGIENLPQAPEYYQNDIIRQIESISRDKSLEKFPDINQKYMTSLNTLKSEFLKLNLPKDQIDWPFL